MPDGLMSFYVLLLVFHLLFVIADCLAQRLREGDTTAASWVLSIDLVFFLA